MIETEKLFDSISKTCTQIQEQLNSENDYVSYVFEARRLSPAGSRIKEVKEYLDQVLKKTPFQHFTSSRDLGFIHSADELVINIVEGNKGEYLKLLNHLSDTQLQELAAVMKSLKVSKIELLDMQHQELHSMEVYIDTYLLAETEGLRLVLHFGWSD